MLRSDSTALFERLREANILLQEVLSGAHENMNSIEQTMVTRVSEFVTTMNTLTERSGAASAEAEQHIGTFNTVTMQVLGDLSQLATQFDSHGRALASAVELIDGSNRRTEESLAERRSVVGRPGRRTRPSNAGSWRPAEPLLQPARRIRSARQPIALAILPA